MRTGLRSNWRRLTLDRVYVFSDMAALVLAYVTALELRFSHHLGPTVYGFINGILGLGGVDDLSKAIHRSVYVSEAFRYLMPLAVALHFLYAMHGMYAAHRFLRWRPVAWHVLVSNAFALAAVTLMLYFRRNTWHPRSFFVTVFVVNVLYVLVLRVLAQRWVAHLRRTRGWRRTPTVLVGTTPEAQTVEEIIAAREPHGTYIAARVDAPTTGDLTALAHAIERTGAKLVVIADDSLPIATTMHVLDLTARMDCAAKVLTHKLSVLQLKAGQSFDTIRGMPLVHFEAPSVSDKNDMWRRIFSRVLAAGSLVVLSPLLLLTALLIKVTDPGPVFFFQERFGVDRRPFRMVKFRTMRVGAEKLLAQLEAQNESGGGLFKLRNDPRITPIGRFLRRYSIDELPQIYNVLKGDMRVVGPRPLPRRDLNNYYEDWHYHRHNGRPGLTCLWQVSGRSEIDFENMCILDVYYLRNRNWVLDLQIVLRTVRVVLLGSGAY